MSFGFDSYQPPVFNDASDINGAGSKNGVSSKDADSFASEARSSSMPDSWASFSSARDSHQSPLDSTSDGSQFGRAQQGFINGMQPNSALVVRQDANGSPYVSHSENSHPSDRASSAFASGLDEDDDHEPQIQGAPFSGQEQFGSASLNVQFA